tara:strand:- start:565 stop:1656 length:1092 start_codon:yes stop_codon:yes gene_type:complete
MRLKCAGISLYRRASIDWCTAEDETAMSSTQHAALALSERENRSLYTASAMLVFVLLCVDETTRCGVPDRGEVDEAAASLKRAQELSVCDQLQRHAGSRKRKRSNEECEEGEREEEPQVAEECKGRSMTRSQECMIIGRGSLTGGGDIGSLACTYFAEVARELQCQLLNGDGDEFVSIGAAPVEGGDGASREEKLAALAAAAESEAGQSIARDLLLSMKLPANIVKTRQHLLLSRDTSTRAGVEYPELTNDSHSMAMAETSFIWKNSESEIEKSVSLLSGLAVLTTVGGADPIRKVDSFGGRVLLPFLATKPCAPSKLRLLLVPESQSWILFSLSTSGAPKIVSCLRGFEGMCDSLLRLSASL